MAEILNVEKNDLYDKLVVKALEQSLAIVRFDTAKRVTYVNGNFANVLGYTTEELYGKEHRIFCFPEFADSPEYDEMWRNLLNGLSY